MNGDATGERLIKGNPSRHYDVGMTRLIVFHRHSVLCVPSDGVVIALWCAVLYVYVLFCPTLFLDTESRAGYPLEDMRAG